MAEAAGGHPGTLPALQGGGQRLLPVSVRSGLTSAVWKSEAGGGAGAHSLEPASEPANHGSVLA